MRFAKLLIVTAMLLTTEASQAQQTSEDEAIANAALAETLAQRAQMAVSGKQIVPATLRESAALLEAASKLDPTEPRFLRLLTEAYLQIGGDEGRIGAISSLSRYRKLMPDDIGAQIRLIDVFYSQQQTASDCKKYIEQLNDATTLSPEVKAHVFVMAARLSAEQSESQRSKKFIDKALELFPLSPEALKMQYEQLDPNSSAAQRVAVVLQILRSNPGQPWAMMQLGNESAAVGLVDPSLIWYQAGLGLMRRMGIAADPTQLTAYAAELVVADQLHVADQLLGQLLKQNPANSDAALLALLIAKHDGNADKIQSATDQARAALMGKLAHISDTISGRSVSATTQPATQVDIPGDVKKLVQVNNPNLTTSYASGLSQLAWVEIYSNGKTADAQQYITALQQLLAPDSVTLTRLEGWSYLIDGKKDEAKVKLSAVAERDPLSELGMIRIETGSVPGEQIVDEARKLLAANPNGLVGAFLIAELRDRVALMPQGPTAEDVHAELDKFPSGWLDFTDPQKVQTMYSLKAEPLKVAHTFGEPILTRITVTNTSDYDITVDPAGAIRPDIWIDAKIRGIAEQYLTGVAIDRLSGKVLLKPRDSVSLIVRADQDGLANVLMSNPSVEVPLYLSALSNPVTQAAGIIPGPGGYRVQFTKPVERGPSPLNEATIQTIYTQLVSGPPDVRLHSIELLGTYIRFLRAHGDDNGKNKATEMSEMVHKSTGDPFQAVRAQASYVTVILSEPNAAQATVQRMLGDESFAMRVLGLEAMPIAYPQAKQKEMAAAVAKDDSDPIVKQLAASLVEVAALPPTSQPATQPTPETAGAEEK
jgi:hypothetical protein